MTAPLLPSSAPPAAGSPGPISWPRVAARILLLLLPTMVVGSLLTSRLVPYDTLLAHPWVGLVPNVLVGMLVGAVLGLALTPTRTRLVGYLGIAGAINIVLVVLLFALVTLRVPGVAGSMDVSSIVAGIVLTLVLQTGVAGGLWWWKSRGRR